MKDELISLGLREPGNILIRVSENRGQEGRKTFRRYFRKKMDIPENADEKLSEFRFIHYRLKNLSAASFYGNVINITTEDCCSV